MSAPLGGRLEALLGGTPANPVAERPNRNVLTLCAEGNQQRRQRPLPVTEHDNGKQAFPFCAIALPFLLTYQSAKLLQNFIKGGCWQLTHKLCLSNFPIKAFYLV